MILGKMACGKGNWQQLYESSCLGFIYFFYVLFFDEQTAGKKMAWPSLKNTVVHSLSTTGAFTPLW